MISRRGHGLRGREYVQIAILIIPAAGLFLQNRPVSAEEIIFKAGLESYSLERTASSAKGPDQTALALALISFHKSGPASKKKAVLDGLAGLPDGAMWQKAASIYFEGIPAASRRARLEVLTQGRPVDSPAALLLGMEKASAGGDPAQWEEAARSFGPALAALASARRALSRAPTGTRDLSAVMDILQLPLTEAAYIPFAAETAAGLPDLLDRAGLPLEAAIISQAIQRGRPALPELQRRVPVHLLHAGDFAGSFRYQTGLDAAFLRHRAGALRAMDWMILGGDYRKALEIHARHLTDNRSFQGDDPWTGFPLTRGILRARAAGILYLSGERKEAFELLEGLTKSRAFDLESGYARLLQSQLLFEDNLDLSRQIAEDLTYRAQEKSLYLLEYHATVLEGLALQRQGKDYLAWINFVKARGIIQTHLKSPPTRGLALGMVLAGLKLNPGGSWKPIVNELLADERKTRDHRGLQLLRDLLPSGHEPLHWKKALLENLAARKLTDDMLAEVGLFLEEPLLHSPGESPGGLSGLDDARFWKRQALLPESEAPPAGWQSGGEGLASVALSRSLASGPVVALLPSRDEVLAVHLIREESALRLETLLLTTACLTDASSGGNCLEQRQKLRIWVDGSPSVFFPAGSLPPMNLASIPARISWVAVSRMSIEPANRGEQTVSASTGYACPEAGLSVANIVPFHRTLQRGGNYLLPPLLRKSSSQPIYLGRLVCGPEEIRLWDLDRFLTPPVSRTYVFSSSEMGVPLTRLAARSGAVLVEVPSPRADLLQKLLGGSYPPDGQYRVIRPAR